jgi:hypothetical protein
MLGKNGIFLIGSQDDLFTLHAELERIVNPQKNFPGGNANNQRSQQQKDVGKILF